MAADIGADAIQRIRDVADAIQESRVHGTIIITDRGNVEISRITVLEESIGISANGLMSSEGDRLAVRVNDGGDFLELTLYRGEEQIAQSAINLGMIRRIIMGNGVAMTVYAREEE